MASSILAPSLKHITEVLALTWRARLTRVAHKAYLSRRTFYLTSQFAGMQVRGQAGGLARGLLPCQVMGRAGCWCGCWACLQAARGAVVTSQHSAGWCSLCRAMCV